MPNSQEPEAPTSHKPPPGAVVSVVYRPVWEVDRQGVDLFYARPVFRDEDGRILADLDPLVDMETCEATAKRQVKYMTRVFGTLRDHLDRGQAYRVMLRMHAHALGTDAGASLVTDAIRTLNKDQRKHVVIDVTDFPETLSVVNMDDITIPLMPFFDTLVARPGKGMTDYTLFANLNYAGVSLDLDDKAIDLKLAGQIFKVFGERAEFRRLPAWILGLPTAEVAKVARIAGAHALSGAYMERDADHPGPPIAEPQPFMV